MAGLKGLKKQRRIQIIVLAAVALLGATGLVGYAMRDGINFFRSPTQVVEQPRPRGKSSASAVWSRRAPSSVAKAKPSPSA